LDRFLILSLRNKLNLCGCAVVGCKNRPFKYLRQNEAPRLLKFESHWLEPKHSLELDFHKPTFAYRPHKQKNLAFALFFVANSSGHA